MGNGLEYGWGQGWRLAGQRRTAGPKGFRAGGRDTGEMVIGRRNVRGTGPGDTTGSGGRGRLGQPVEDFGTHPMDDGSQEMAIGQTQR